VGVVEMMENHLKRSLSPIQKWSMNTIVKRKIKLTVSFTMTNGTGHRQNWAGEAIIIRRSDVERVHAYAREHCSLRDFLIVHLPMEIGLRNSEIRTLRRENIHFENRSFEVLDSKKLELFPLPLDMLSLQLIKDLVGDKTEGYVFTHEGSWTNVKHDMPLSRVEIWQIVHEIAEEAGVKNCNPRILRHYFAAHWIFDLKGNIVVLQRILRHKNLTVTTIYVSKLSFFEDIQKAYEGIRNSPLVPETTDGKRNNISRRGVTSPEDILKVTCAQKVAGETICNGCDYVGFCKYAPLPSCASECRFKPKIKEELKI
jgi:site-specific recombinase XerC